MCRRCLDMSSCQYTVLTITILMNALQVKAKHEYPLLRQWRKRSVCSCMPTSLCAHTAVTFSGIIKESAVRIEIPGMIKCDPWKSVSSWHSWSLISIRSVCLLFCGSAPDSFTLCKMSLAFVEIVIRYILKTVLQPDSFCT